jgi:Ca-activated chloride channel family protein
MLEDPALQAQLAAVLRGVERSAGSSGWLKDLYLQGARQGLYKAMVNYEAVLIETNQALEREGLETLHLIYPADGTALADSPLGFVARGQPDTAAREAFLLALQEHMLSPPIQKRILAAGRRTGLGGTAAEADPGVFRKAWGIDADRMPPVIRFPSVATIERALALYQEALRKPSLLALCLDFSGSMQGEGVASLKAAVGRLFDPETARRYLLQPSRDDVFVVLAFDSDIKDEWVAKGPEEAARVPARVDALQPGGGTDIYRCASVAIATMMRRPEWSTHLPGVILMTDGKSQGEADTFAATFRDDRLDVPVHGITFGDADASQLERLAKLTRARVFDGRRNLEEAFRHARGYN